MTEPLALVAYERVLPGSQLVNRLQDMAYRVQTVPGPETLVETAASAKPLLVIADLGTKTNQMCEAIGQLKRQPETAHIPVIAIVAAGSAAVEKAARDAKADLVVTDSAIQIHFKQLLDQALHLE